MPFQLFLRAAVVHGQTTESNGQENSIAAATISPPVTAAPQFRGKDPLVAPFFLFLLSIALAAHASTERIDANVGRRGCKNLTRMGITASKSQ